MKTLTSVVKALGEQPEESVTNQERRQEAEERQCRGFLSPDPHPIHLLGGDLHPQ